MHGDLTKDLNKNITSITYNALNLPNVITFADGNTAVRQNNAKMIRYLLNHGVDKSKREFAACYDDAKEGQNAYEIAKDLGYNEIIDLLK